MSVGVAAGRTELDRRLDQELWQLVEEVRTGADTQATPGAEIAERVMGTRCAEAATQTEVERGEAAPAQPPGGGRFILNRATGRAHGTADDWSDTLPIGLWRTRCGWSFGGGLGALCNDRPAPPWCARCFPGGPPGGGDISESD